MGHESEPKPTGGDIVDFVARARHQGILPSDLDEADGTMLSFYYGVFAEDRTFRTAVQSRMRQLDSAENADQRVAASDGATQYPLFPEDDNPEPVSPATRGRHRPTRRTLTDWLGIFHAKHDVPGTELTHEPIREGRPKGLDITRLLEGYGTERRFPCGCSVRTDRDGIVSWSSCGHADDGDCTVDMYLEGNDGEA